jgi:hypothetical protein
MITPSSPKLRLALAAFVAVAMPIASAADKHLGAATCASSVCHGKVAKQADRNVWLNEYRTWLQEDKHSQAYKLLLNAQSKSIAAKLGIGDASKAKICLDCHADNVPAAQRGPRFQIADGVGCEACHGGAERWIQSHAAKSATHADNLARGMLPTESATRRADICARCHVGDPDQMATHVIMGAGHPRLAFELETYTNNQPAHFEVDKDYVQRKGRVPGVNLWLTGQLRAAESLLAMMRSNRLRPAGTAFPEIALYDCHACHHPMDKQRWTRTRVGPGATPGLPRLHSGYLTILQAVAEAIAPGELPALVDGTNALIRVGQQNVAGVPAATQPLSQWIRARDGWTRQAFSPAQVGAIRRMLVKYASSERASDFAAAEQVVMGVESLSYSMGDRDRYKRALDALYATVQSATAFEPGRFAAAARDVQGQF